MTKQDKKKSYNKYRKQREKELFEYDKVFFCPGCETWQLKHKWTLDHVIKRSQSMYYYDDPRNLKDLCIDCNSLRESKGDSALKCAKRWAEIQRELRTEYNNLSLADKKL